MYRIDQQQLLHIRELVEDRHGEGLRGKRQNARLCRCITRKEQLLVLKLSSEALQCRGRGSRRGSCRIPVCSGDVIGSVAGQERVPRVGPGPLEAVVDPGYGVDDDHFSVHGLLDDIGVVQSVTAHPQKFTESFRLPSLATESDYVGFRRSPRRSLMDDNSMLAKWNGLLDRIRFPARERPFPTDAHLDLLKAALLPAEHAEPAWRRWKDRGHQLQTVYGASVRLFPQLWANRDAAGIGAEDLPLLKGAYRQVLADNSVKLRAALGATRPLVETGIPVLFLTGAAMISIADGRLGLRPIRDVDVLVPEPDAERAVALLLDAGHEAHSGPARLGASHSWSCSDANGTELDVHWWAFTTAGNDSGIFESAQEATLLGRPVLIPSATDCLVAAVANAFSGCGSPLRWIADSMLLFQFSIDTIDWDVFLERARRPGLTLGLAAGLDFLAQEFSAPVPDYVIDELRRRPVSWRGHAAHWVAVTRPPGSVLLLSHMVRLSARRPEPVDGWRCST